MKKCKQCDIGFDITDKDRDFYQKMGVTDPTICPACRQQRRMSFRNEKNLYHDKCDLCGKKMLSTFSSDKPQKVYCSDCWWSDNWDPLEHGRSYDFSRPFFEQAKELFDVVPYFNLYSIKSENCDYTHYAGLNKNCYLLFGGYKNEDSLYCDTPIMSRNLIDCLFCTNSELGYEQIDCNNNYRCAFLQNSDGNKDSWFLFDCQNCDHCIGCTNLRNKSYYIFNKPCSEQEFEILKKSFSSVKKLVKFKNKFKDFIKNEAIHPPTIGTNNENVQGNFIFNSKNIYHSYSIWDCEDIRYSFKMHVHKDSVDCTGCAEGQVTYESLASSFSFNTRFIFTGLHLQDCDYSMYCYHSRHLFGCIGLRHKKYCILNKQYSKEQYEELMPKIIEHMKSAGEWGQFFPVKYSPFAYNETAAYEYYPLTKEDVLQRGWQWKNPDPKEYQPQTYEVPDNIQEVSDSIMNEILACTDCGRNYKIIIQELKFYRQIGLPIPTKCFYCRHKDRLNLRTPHKLWRRNCVKCNNEIQTTYAPERHEKVYCEQCYLNEVY